MLPLPVIKGPILSRYRVCHAFAEIFLLRDECHYFSKSGREDYDEIVTKHMASAMQSALRKLFSAGRKTVYPVEERTYVETLPASLRSLYASGGAYKSTYVHIEGPHDVSSRCTVLERFAKSLTESGSIILSRVG